MRRTRNQRPRVSIVMLTFNSIRYLPFVFDSVFKQTVIDDIEFIVVDNASDIKTKRFLRAQKEIVLIENEHNTGFAEGNNIGIERAQGDFILCLNHDVILKPDYIEKLALYMDEHPYVGSASGAIYKWDFKRKKSLTDMVDTLGFRVNRSRKIVDADVFYDDADQDGGVEVFGVSAAVAMYRREAVDQLIAVSGHFFDPDFIAYKEDIDVAYRLRHLGFRSFVVKDAIAFHDRWETGSGKKGFKKLKTSRKQKQFVNELSYKNHLILLFKNEFYSQLFIDGFFILFFEVSKFFYLLIFETRTLKGLFSFFKELPLTLKKRHAIFRKSQVKRDFFADWIY